MRTQSQERKLTSTDDGFFEELAQLTHPESKTVRRVCLPSDVPRPKGQQELLRVTSAAGSEVSSEIGAQFHSQISSLGWKELARCDGWLDAPRTPFAGSAAELALPSLMGIGSLLDCGVPDGRVNRLYHSCASLTGDPLLLDSPPFLSVMVRTQGRRLGSLEDALTCLAAQSCQDFEVVIVLHSTDLSAWRSVRALAESFGGAFRQKIDLLVCGTGKRAAPLNMALENCRGEYVTALDDDDYVMSHWVESFLDARDLGRGQILRIGCASQEVVVLKGVSREVAIAVAGPTVEYGRPWNFMEHLYENQTPIHAYATPRWLVEDVGLRYDASLPVCEDWDFLIRAALFVGVSDFNQVAAVYNRHDLASSTVHSLPEWEQARDQVRRRLNEVPLILPAGSLDLASSNPGPSAGELTMTASLSAALEMERQARSELETALEEERTRLIGALVQTEQARVDTDLALRAKINEVEELHEFISRPLWRRLKSRFNWGEQLWRRSKANQLRSD